MKKQRHHMIAALAGLARALPWRIMNKGPGSGAEDGSWYRIKNLAENAAPDDPLEIEIYGEIGTFGITAAEFLAELKASDDGQRPIIVAINSIGGETPDAFAIHNALQRLGERVTARIDGWALSAAGLVAVGAHRVQMHKNAILMMHNPWSWASGDADEFRKVADILDKFMEGIIACYQHRPNLKVDEAELRRMIGAETWLTANEAKELGFADEVLSGSGSVSNTANLRILNRYRNMPDDVRAQIENQLEPAPPPEPSPEPDPEPEPQPADLVALAALATAECAKAGITDHAEIIIKASALKDEASVHAAVKQAKEIKALCVLAQQPTMAAELIKNGATPDQARAALFDKLVSNSSQFEISNHPPVDANQPAPGVRAVNPGDVYNARRQNLTASKGVQK